MGLTNWKNAPEGRILKSDVAIAKNYLDEKQIRQLERMVTGYFDYIIEQATEKDGFTGLHDEKAWKGMRRFFVGECLFLFYILNTYLV